MREETADGENAGGAPVPQFAVSPAEFLGRFYRHEPEVLFDTELFSVVWKPHGMPSAPLRENEGGNLLAWYLDALASVPGNRGGKTDGAECGASRVEGRKKIERGLLHRLDTDTAGLLLIAKTQDSFDFLFRAQTEGRFRKTYLAFCSHTPVPAEDGAASPVSPEPPLAASVSQILSRGFPPCADGTRFPIPVESRFRAFGEGGREVRPVFSSARTIRAARAARRRKAVSPRVYRTDIESLSALPGGECVRVLCSLRAGFRHQVRTHLAACGLPICGDRLYHPVCRTCQGDAGGPAASSCADAVRGKAGCVGKERCALRLYAVALSFPSPGGGPPIFFSLPPKDKTSL